MRCLTLAEGLKQRGAHIRFISRDLPVYFRDLLAEKSIEFVLLPSDTNLVPTDGLAHAHWLGTSQEQDAQATIQALSGQLWDWLVVDHYALDARWEMVLRQTAKSILVIDDIADRQHDCDILLDQNFYSDMDTRYTSRVPAHCRLLLGPRYALLRDEFRQLREQAKPRTGPVRRILVFFGGVDADNYTGRTIGALASIGIEGLHVDVVIGAQHPHREFIESSCAEHHFNCHVQTSRMAELMAVADLSIGAGGSAIWERCCVGLPTLTVYTADNQFQQVVDAASAGLLYAPELKDELLLVIKRHVRTLLENSCLIQTISTNAMQTVDGCGTTRVIGNMGCSNIRIRSAIQEDSERLYEWRNHPTIRAMSRNSESINWEDHQKWFDNVLTSQERLLLIGQRDGAPVGVVRFDIVGDQAEVSIYIVPSIKESGVGRALLHGAEGWLAANRPEISKIRAYVLGGNQRSQNLFLGAGYQDESASYLKRIHKNG